MFVLIPVFLRAPILTHATQVFAGHGIGGVVGNILTGLFAQKSIAGFDGFTVIGGGWLDRHYIQLGYQLADSTAGLSYAFVMTVCVFSCFLIP
jgi:Amt family ammonium transporter